MTIAKFVSAIAEGEGKKVQTSVGNIREMLKVANKLSKGELYKLIKKL